MTKLVAFCVLCWRRTGLGGGDCIKDYFSNMWKDTTGRVFSSLLVFLHLTFKCRPARHLVARLKSLEVGVGVSPPNLRYDSLIC